MKIISAEEYNKKVVESALREQHPIIKELMDMKVGECAELLKSEWNKKTPLQVYVGNYKIRMGMELSIRTAKDFWLIKRIA